MATELHIRWDGDVPGLSEHRLSVSKFGPSLRNLLLAARRIANSVVRNGTVDGPVSVKGGLGREAASVDLFIESISDGCVQIRSSIGPCAGGQQSIWGGEELYENTLIRLIGDIELASKTGDLTRVPAPVGRYLRELPSGIREQRYAAYRGKTLLAEVQFGPMVIEPDVTKHLVRIASHVGVIAGIEVVPQRSVLLITESGKRIKCSANDDDVFALAKHRLGEKDVFFVRHTAPGVRDLVRIGRARRPSEDECKSLPSALMKRWDAVMKVLAQ